jgi:hypothetical protein
MPENWTLRCSLPINRRAQNTSDDWKERRNKQFESCNRNRLESSITQRHCRRHAVSVHADGQVFFFPGLDRLSASRNELKRDVLLCLIVRMCTACFGSRDRNSASCGEDAFRRQLRTVRVGTGIILGHNFNSRANNGSNTLRCIRFTATAFILHWNSLTWEPND